MGFSPFLDVNIAEIGRRHSVRSKDFCRFVFSKRLSSEAREFMVFSDASQSSNSPGSEKISGRLEKHLDDNSYFHVGIPLNDEIPLRIS
jgi:hypothetical protein